ncbi:hypothetical protein [Bradyrhizobium cosmicum]|uniref:hypothetical protein n=1 Tax=Bradyrhizobium cosmicum TaxID=1404864 RepID=UPI0028E540B1|nr:hypothetical protein [Bradyrhizobium cosmicum]
MIRALEASRRIFDARCIAVSRDCSLRVPYGVAVFHPDLLTTEQVEIAVSLPINKGLDLTPAQWTATAAGLFVSAIVARILVFEG